MALHVALSRPDGLSNILSPEPKLLIHAMTLPFSGGIGTVRSDLARNDLVDNGVWD